MLDEGIKWIEWKQVGKGIVSCFDSAHELSQVMKNKYSTESTAEQRVRKTSQAEQQTANSRPAANFREPAGSLLSLLSRQAEETK